MKKGLKLQGGRVVFFMVETQRVLAGLLALGAGTPILETRSGYRAHFTLHTNNFPPVGWWWVTAGGTPSSPLLHSTFPLPEKELRGGLSEVRTRTCFSLRLSFFFSKDIKKNNS